ncbi:MAG: sigma-70 family RNA polymerase sigma factor [Alicyclobacillaceae bacterium]|nr:sigma-70 family RNA polymerase sigma factor [Alicyclobacillaceae bacterium]
MPESFQVLFRTHYPTVLRHLLRIVADRPAAEDLAQEVFLRLYRSPPQRLEAVGAWLHKVAARVAYDYLRAKAARWRLEMREWALNAGPRDIAGDEWMARHADREAVKQALMQLSERDRQVLLLRHSGYSYEEIAEIVGVRREIVGTVLSRAQQRFKQVYQREEGASHAALDQPGQASV